MATHANNLHRSKLSKTKKLILKIANFMGTPTFLIFCILLVTIPFMRPVILPYAQYASSGVIQLIALPIIIFQGVIQSEAESIKADIRFEHDKLMEKDMEYLKRKINQKFLSKK